MESSTEREKIASYGTQKYLNDFELKLSKLIQGIFSNGLLHDTDQHLL